MVGEGEVLEIIASGIGVVGVGGEGSKDGLGKGVGSGEGGGGHGEGGKGEAKWGEEIGDSGLVGRGEAGGTSLANLEK